MAKLYGLTAADRKLLAADHKRTRGGSSSQKPTAKRRRGPRGGAAKGGGKLAWVLVTNSVGAGSLNASANTVTAGHGSSAGILFLLDDDGNFTVARDGEGTSAPIVRVDVKWTSVTPLRATSDEPIFMAGELRGSVFVPMPVDLRMLPGFVPGQVQIAYHAEGSRAFGLGAAACPEPPAP